ncbi:MAG: 1-deoxy-D-xylulose-5-phosphate synthase [Betaproteobacteria bacterium]|nr:MAG: 1-deoxy-D-xylulose-5-phosphate synthase [Betaproteobacteria bacterium]TMH67706.1 MAG: 1-deoxy-D-xylulose-5-phosphate synthase [Betaproteobacteria bacterium]
MFPLLESIDDPAELRRLERAQLPQLARELRAFLLNAVAQTGGHLSSNLGTVELTIALHYVFDTPRDRIVWDVGHQTYAHKILTGRRAQMNKLRQWGGPAGFPRRDESPYDTFGTAHSSTSISAALGMAVAASLAGAQRHIVAVIGDGAMSAGMAFEALNNAEGANLLVILNDNDMSISEPVGAINQYLAKVLASRLYNTMRRGGKEVLAKLGPVHELAKRAEEHVKGMVLPGTLFEEFGFNYIGPIDGHDLDALVDTLANVRALKGPQFLHVVTRKGYGYARAEEDPILYHGVTKFDPAVGIVPKPAAKPTYTQIFGDWLCDMAAADRRLVGITPAMREGSGLVRFSQAFPERYFDVGIAEQHAVTFAAGLACEGMKPVVAIYSTFLQRAYDQAIHDVALQNLPVVFAIDRAGVVGADGPTHLGAFDLTYLRCLPNATVMAPADENECRKMLTTAFRMNTPAAVRYPRGSGPGVAVDASLIALPIGRGEVRREAKRRNHRIAILAFGSMVAPALVAAEEFDATVANMRFVKPLDHELVLRLAREHDALVTVEENVVAGGAGSGVAELLALADVAVPMLHLGLPDAFPDHGDPAVILAHVGLDANGIAASIRARFAVRKSGAWAKPAA